MKVSIRKLTFESDFFAEQLAKSKSMAAFATALGFNFCNDFLSEEIQNVVDQLGLDTDHFKRGNGIIKYPYIKKYCPICNIEFETQKGHPREKTTCSHKCSNTYFAQSKHTEGANLKRSIKAKENQAEKQAALSYKYFKYQEICFLYNISFTREALTDNSSSRIFIANPIEEQNCLFCNKLFTLKPKKKTQKYCSSKCTKSCPIIRAKLALKVQERISNGTHKGWAKRDNLEPSYPEKYIIKLLTELGYTLKLTDGYIANYPTNSNEIIITRESKEGKWFIDFADIDRKLALEIDGKQHELPERKASDEAKDKYLIDNGWQVLRIKWKKVDVIYRNELIEKITKFFA